MGPAAGFLNGAKRRKIKSLSSPQVKPSFSYRFTGVSSPSGFVKLAVPLLKAASASGFPFLMALS